MGKKLLRVKDIVGILKHTPEEAEEFRRRVLEERRLLNEGFLAREKFLRRRYKNFFKSDS